MLKACDMFEVAKVRAGAEQKISGPLSWDLMVTYCRMQVGKNAFMCRVYPPAFGQRLVRLWCEAEPEQQLSLRTDNFFGFESCMQKTFACMDYKIYLINIMNISHKIWYMHACTSQEEACCCTWLQRQGGLSSPTPRGLLGRCGVIYCIPLPLDK